VSAVSWANLETFTTPPAQASVASSGDDWFRSFATSIATGLSSGFLWPGSGGGSLASAGVSLLGNGRLARAGNSAVTGGYGDGFLLLNQNHISLHHIGSTWTGLLGHSKMEDHGSGAGRWVTQASGFSILASDGSFGTKNVSFSSTYAVAPPWVFVAEGSGSAQYLLNVSSVTTGGFSSVWSALAASLVDISVFWQSEGTI
jgi:hypothetical protein